MDARFRFIVGLLVLVNAVLGVFLCSLIVTLQADVAQLQNVLATKEDILTVSAPRMELFHEEKCTTCHTERRFAGAHNVRGEIEIALEHMKDKPDVALGDEDMAKIHASLTLLRCTRCHDADLLRSLALATPGARLETVRRMIPKPGSGISPDESAEILRALEQSVGF